MTDQQRRKTLKLITGAGAGLSLAGLPLVGHAAALVLNPASATAQVLSPLQIEVLAGKAVSGDTVIIRNNTSAAMVIDHFTPGIVAFKDSMIDLNMLLQDNKIAIAPQQTMSAIVAEWQLLAVPMFKEYLWVDDSAIVLSEDTQIVRLEGVLKGRQAILSTAEALVYS